METPNPNVVPIMPPAGISAGKLLVSKAFAGSNSINQKSEKLIYNPNKKMKSPFTIDKFDFGEFKPKKRSEMPTSFSLP